MFTNFATGKYQPMAWLSFGLDHSLWGMNPMGYHLTSLLVHCANAVLFYVLALRLLALALPRVTAERLPWGAGFCALFFSLHPLRAESVAWATERGGLLSACFFMLSLLAYLRWSTGKGWKWLAASVGAFGLSLLAKAVGITMPLILILLDFYPLRRLTWSGIRRGDDAARAVLAEKAPFFALALLFAMIGVQAQATTVALVGFDRFGPLDRLAQAFYGAAFYVEKSLWPARLSPLYQAILQLEPWSFLARTLAAMGLSAAAFLARKRHPGFLAAWAFYLLALLPVCGLVKLGLPVASDRYAYIPSLSLALIAGVAALWAGRTRAGRLVCAALLTALAALSWRQAGTWHDPVTFWSRALSLDPSCYVCEHNLAAGLAAADRVPEAKLHLAESRRVQLETKCALGQAFLRQGRPAAAAIRFRDALTIDPASACAQEGLKALTAAEGH